MEDEAVSNRVNIIRESTRNLLKINRQFHSYEQIKRRRYIQETTITKEAITEITNKLKTQSSISVQELQMLKNGLIDDSKNIEVVLNTHGALRGIIRELTGHDVKKQCEAAGCCCNLALGDTRACMTVARAAGSYLTATLDILTIELTVTCAWTLGSLAGADLNICNILISQGALTKLAVLHTNEDLQDAALYALVHFTYQLKDDLSIDHLTTILQTLLRLEFSMASSHVLFILSCHVNFSENITQDMLQKILGDLSLTMYSHSINCTQKKICCKLVYLIRTLANMERFYADILDYLCTNKKGEAVRRLLHSNKYIVESSLWLLGNLYNFCDDKQFFYKFI